MMALDPIAPGVWVEGPRLIGGRTADGRIVFPVPDGPAGEACERVALSPQGTLWSWTIQGFEPKRPPYDGPSPFAPFMVGMVELPGEVILVSRIVDVAEPTIGMPLRLTIVPFDDTRSTYAFGPVS